jgi:hypothetical protein
MWRDTGNASRPHAERTISIRPEKDEGPLDRLRVAERRNRHKVGVERLVDRREVCIR